MPAFHRIVRADPPKPNDSVSDRARGRRPPPDPEHLRLWDGISVYQRLAQARRKARGVPGLGRYIAILDIPEGSHIRYERTSRSSGHFTLWGDAEAIAACLVTVVLVDE
jgi:hypothetical protein